MLLAALGYWAWAQPPALTAGRPASAVAAGGGLRVHAGRIVDAQGRDVDLRGFNVSALVAYPNPYSAGVAPLDEEDARLMSASGFDVARLAISWALLEPRPGQIDARYLDRIQRAVEMLERHGLRVVLDMHIGIGWGAQAQIPGWASVAAVPDVRWFPVEPWTDRVSPQPVADEIHFWTSESWQVHLAGAWQAVAARFRHDPMLAGYDLFNEPHPLPMPPAVFEAHFMWPLYARLIDAISGVDPGHLFIVESTLFDGFPTATTALHAPNLVYSPHLYTGSLIPTRAGDVRSAVSAELAQRRSEAASLPAAMWVGELGIDHEGHGAGAWTDASLSAMAGQGVGWAWWQWRQDGGWGIRSVDGRRVDRAALRGLARPYLKAAPSGVALPPARAAGGGGAGIEIQVSPDHGAAPVAVGWSDLTLGTPSVQGSCLASPPSHSGAGTYELALAPGRGCTIGIEPANG